VLKFLLDLRQLLVCRDPRGERRFRDILDPFPVIRRALAGSADSGEALTLCWNWAGDAVVIPANTESPAGVANLTQNLPPWEAWTELKRLHREPAAPFNLLQVSDLHFGAASVTPRSVTYVEQHLRGRIDAARKTNVAVQPIITGDLMDTPSERNLGEFEAFRNRLDAAAGTPTVCIPGNHDLRKKGFLWPKWEQVSSLEWSSVIASEASKIVFVCFDTSKGAKLAQGKITDAQFVEVATKLDAMKASPKYADHIFVCLVHHHPFSTQEDEMDTLPFLGIREERFLRMENGEQLVQWCARKEVALILHGHKHRPRFVGREIVVNSAARPVRAIGCGSSFGIEGKPLSYNWLTWQPGSRTWTVSFMADPGDGSGFAEKRFLIGR